MEEIRVKHKVENRQFQILLDDQLSHIQYGFKGNTMFMMQTKVPESHQGRGIASKLAMAALNYAKDNNHKIGVMCPFVLAYVKRHPEWFDYFDRSYHKKLPNEA